ncbi:MAG: DMT family transporter [Chitinophagaceae bacterium]|nr:DMT family transporter [Oligoflexus sp.]
MANQNGRDSLLSVALLIVGMVSIQFSATMAKHLFETVHPAVITMMRTSFAAVFMLAVMRPWREKMAEKAWRRVALYGATLGVMNLLFYLALRRIPLGIAVALEFTGPLGVALFGSRRALDIVWVLLATLGIYILLPAGGFSADLDLVGVLLALSAGCCWGLYIVFGKKAGSVASTRQAAAWGMVFAALIVLPFGLFHLDLNVLPLSLILRKGLLLALLSSAIPYSLEMIVLRKMDSKTFGTLMSIEPVIAALMGLIFLREYLQAFQILAMLAITTACLGATITAPKTL